VGTEGARSGDTARAGPRSRLGFARKGGRKKAHRCSKAGGKEYAGNGSVGDLCFSSTRMVGTESKRARAQVRSEEKDRDGLPSAGVQEKRLCVG